MVYKPFKPQERSKVLEVAGHPFFRSYGARLPSSLTRFHSRAWVYSTHPPVSVYGTGDLGNKREVFLVFALKNPSWPWPQRLLAQQSLSIDCSSPHPRHSRP